MQSKEAMTRAANRSKRVSFIVYTFQSSEVVSLKAIEGLSERANDCRMDNQSVSRIVFATKSQIVSVAILPVHCAWWVV